MAKKFTWQYITKEATSAKDMSRHDTLRFHYFNPNGLTQRYTVLRERLFAAVDAGKCKSGSLLAHSWDFQYKQLDKHLKKRGVRWLQVQVWVKMAEDEYASLEAFLEKIGA